MPHTPHHSPKDHADLDDDHHHEGEDDEDAQTDLCRNDQVDNNPQPIVVVSHVLKVNNDLTNQDQINWSCEQIDTMSNHLQCLL